MVSLRPSNHKDEKKLCYEAARVVLKAAGILPSPTQSTFVQQVYKQLSSPLLSPEIHELPKAHLKTMQFDEQELEAMKGKEGSEDG